VAIFASQTTATIPLDGGAHTATIRKLTGREYERAQADHLRQFVAGHSPRVWAVALRKILSGDGANVTARELADAHADPLLGFDRYTIVTAGLVAWTVDGGTPTPDQINDLDDDTVETIARAILELSKPSLFQSAAERDAAKKND